MVYNALVWPFYPLAGIDWLGLLQTAGTLVTAYIAYRALKNWQYQDKAKREIEFLDALIDAVHSYIDAMGRPIALVETVRIGMRSQTSSWDDEDESGAVAKGAIPYILKDGEHDARRLVEALNEARPASTKLRSLGTKGQVFGFNGYAKCHTAIEVLVRQFGRIEALATLIGSPTLNWKNPSVQRTLQGVLTVEPRGIQKQVADSNVAVLEFSSQTYVQLYGAKRRIPPIGKRS